VRTLTWRERPPPRRRSGHTRALKAEASSGCIGGRLRLPLDERWSPWGPPRSHRTAETAPNYRAPRQASPPRSHTRRRSVVPRREPLAARLAHPWWWHRPRDAQSAPSRSDPLTAPEVNFTSLDRSDDGIFAAPQRYPPTTVNYGASAPSTPSAYRSPLRQVRAERHTGRAPAVRRGRSSMALNIAHYKAGRFIRVTP
jgi:hypothetical protein